jgi:adenine-specific DNA-methyltransferase
VDKFRALRDELGDPTYGTDDTLIYTGDCMQVLERLTGSPIDLTVTSPPYNIGKEYERALPLPDYLAWCGKWMTRLHEVTEPTGTFWLNLGYVPVVEQGKAVPLAYMLWDKSPFFMLQEVVWTYGAGVASRHTFSPRNEKFLWFVKDPTPGNYTFNLDAVRDPDVKYPNQKKNGKIKVNPLGKNPGDVWSIPKVTSGAGRASKERTSHPAQFPEAVIERIILASTDPGDVVLDPFLGSGTTAAVAKRLGRRCIGLELRPDYVAVAVQRLEQQDARGSQLALEDR